MNTDTNNLVQSIISDPVTNDLLNAYGLKSHKVTWEDTGRNKGSCWGPNISDMTLALETGDKLMPVIRKPNFTDITHDIPIEDFKVRVGNEKKDSENKVISFKEYIKNLKTYTANDKVEDLSNERDSVVLTTCQCCVLPCKKGGETEFNVQLFNYQSYNDNPAVLVILASKDGTSAQVLETSNQKLYFNDRGIARNFKAERLQDVREKETGKPQEKVKSHREMKDTEKMDNVLMIIQIPLKVRSRSRGCPIIKYEFVSKGLPKGWKSMSSSNSWGSSSRGLGKHSASGHRRGHGMDMGMLRLGREKGKFIGTKDLKLERDERFPIRCTFQYYRLTDENFISEEQVKDIAEQLNKVESKALASGSLVASNSERVTEPDLSKPKEEDCPFGKLEERNYENPWEQEEQLASFV